ncbi:MAG: hypothetical protein ABUR63_06505 [Verrucomicrobiota bacterium]
MWRGLRTLSVLSAITLLGSGVVRAKPRRVVARSEPATPGAENQPLFEAEPRPTAPVMRDPEILSRGEMLSLLKKYSSDMADALQEGERHRETAIRKKDAIKLACIQDRLSSMKVMKQLSDERQAATAREDIRSDDLRLRHEFRGVELSYRRVVELHRELMECVGDNLEVTGEPENVPVTPGDSMSVGASSNPPERPTTASIYK